VSVYEGGGISQAQAGALVHPGMRSGGVVYGPQVSSTALGAAVAADTIYGIPLLVRGPVTIAGLQIVVGTSTVGVLGKLGIARATTGGMGALLAECNATVDMNTAANTALQAGFASNPTLQDGWHWLLCKFNGAAQPYTLNQATTGAGGLVSLFGAQNLGPFIRSIGASAFMRAELAQAYASALPADLTAATFGASAPGAPVMGIVTA
jgi:hypothetical protein